MASQSAPILPLDVPACSGVPRARAADAKVPTNVRRHIDWNSLISRPNGGRVAAAVLPVNANYKEFSDCCALTPGRAVYIIQPPKWGSIQKVRKRNGELRCTVCHLSLPGRSLCERSPCWR